MFFRRLEGFCSLCRCCSECCADTQFVLSYLQVLLESGPFSAKGNEILTLFRNCTNEIMERRGQPVLELCVTQSKRGHG